MKLTEKSVAVGSSAGGSVLNPSTTSTPTVQTPTPKPSPTPSVAPTPTFTPLPGALGMDIGPQTRQFKASGPITAVANQTITGLHITNPNGPCIRVTGNNVRIHQNKIGPCGPGESGVGITAEDVSQLQVDHNWFEDVASGLYLNGYDRSGAGLLFEKNYATKVRGPMPRGQIIQFDKVRGANIVIRCNISDQKIGGYGSGPEDHVSLYASSGTAASPIQVMYNKVRGGGSSSGGGLMAGDNNGSYLVIRDNILVEPGQYGIAIAGGINIKLLRNLIYGSQNSWTNVGAYVWNQYEYECSGHEVRGNRVRYANKDGTQNPYWNAGNCGLVAGNDDNVWGDNSLSPAVWDTVFNECK